VRKRSKSPLLLRMTRWTVKRRGKKERKGSCTPRYVFVQAPTATRRQAKGISRELTRQD
jgi:hypothetical protein